MVGPTVDLNSPRDNTVVVPMVVALPTPLQGQPANNSSNNKSCTSNNFMLIIRLRSRLSQLTPA